VGFLFAAYYREGEISVSSKRSRFRASRSSSANKNSRRKGSAPKRAIAKAVAGPGGAKPEPELFPMFLKLSGRLCLVVGAGHVAEPKIESLLRCGARVRVVAPSATAAVREAASAGRLVWEQRAFGISDLDGIFLVVAATSSPELHQLIFREARQAAILCNSVDEPSRCDFYYPAVVRRGPLQIAISTSGNSPSLAQRLRRELEQQFGPAYGPWVAKIGKVRSAAMALEDTPEQRKNTLKEISSDGAFRRFQRRAEAKRSAKPRASRIESPRASHSRAQFGDKD
jgi:precorrin-2 dehydrogenase/sirohydrochlorin ferrochelatase